MANYGNYSQKITPVVLNLIIINVLVYVAQVFLNGPDQIITSYLVRFPLNSGHFSPYQLVTAIFTHLEFFHLLFNMFALWVFGVMLEKIWGPVKFLIFYLSCGLAAGVAAIFLSDGVGLGASGAIMGLLGAFAYLFPNTPFVIFPIPFPLKAKFLVLIVAAIDVLGTFSKTPAGGTGIGHFAHIGGLVMGLILVIIWNKTNKKTFY